MPRQRFMPWLALVAIALSVNVYVADIDAAPSGAILVMSIDGPISPATDDYLRTTLTRAKDEQARLVVLELNTQGGLLNSMQTMVTQILASPVPVAVYVHPGGGGAMSAGTFITLAGHIAAMTPGTTIGAAHPVTGTGDDVSGDMRAKVENFAVSLITAIAEQRGRNVKWAEQAVRESVAITDREALEKKIIDVDAVDLEKLLAEIEGRTVSVNGSPVTLIGLSDAPRENVPMSMRQLVINILADPNIAILLGLAALLGIGIELYHPGSFAPGIVGVIALILSLTSAQVLPINYGGLALLMLGGVFFIVELFLPSFGIWGIAGIVCLVVGSIYFIDTDRVWSSGGFEVNRLLVGSIAGFVGAILLGISYLVVQTTRRQVHTGREGLIGKIGTVKIPFAQGDGSFRGKIMVMGEIWDAQLSESDDTSLGVGDKVQVCALESGLTLVVKPVRQK